MKPPKSINIGGYVYSVTVDEALANVVALDNGEGRVLGATRYRHQSIVLDPDQHPQQLRDTLLHEVLHALNDTAYALGDPRTPIEEETILRLTPPLLTLLRDNPKLVEFLVEP
jgi:hypothetical protein